ncbi:hypothetical protein HK101_003579, partial [Irineochytrium annulatum]
SRLKKVKRPGDDKKDGPPPKPKIDEAVVRNELLIELMGFMEAPGGNLEELTDKCKSSTATSRGFIFSLIRRGWLIGYRFTDELPPAPKGGVRPPCIVFPGREWTNKIELEDIDSIDLVEDRLNDDETQIVAHVHMYRFDEASSNHVMDEIALVKGPKYPDPVPPFDEKEPPTDNSLENRKKHDEWEAKLQAYQQGDYAQYSLIFGKLQTQDVTTVSAYEQLHKIMASMRNMAEGLKSTFEKLTLDQLRANVNAVPSLLKAATKQLQEERGIIIRGELKITPKFLKLYKEEEERKKKRKEEEEALKKMGLSSSSRPTSPTESKAGSPLSPKRNSVAPIGELVDLLEESYVKIQNAKPEATAPRGLGRSITYGGRHKTHG